MRPFGAALAAIAVVAMVGVAFGGGAPAGAGASAAGPYPVSYDFLLSAVAAGAQSRRRSAGREQLVLPAVGAAHPRTGRTGARHRGQQERQLADLRAAAGRQRLLRVLADLRAPLARRRPDQFGGLDNIESSAVQLAAFVAEVLAATGAARSTSLGTPRAP